MAVEGAGEPPFQYWATHRADNHYKHRQTHHSNLNKPRGATFNQRHKLLQRKKTTKHTGPEVKAYTITAKRLKISSGICFIAFFLSLCSYLVSLSANSESEATRDWIEVYGRLDSSKQTSLARSSAHAIAYSYKYNGIEYRSERYSMRSVNAPDLSFLQSVSSNTLDTALQVGGLPITVYINPESPSSSVLYRHPPTDSGWAGAIAVSFFAATGILYILSLRHRS